jgi:hypothetical protein
VPAGGTIAECCGAPGYFKTRRSCDERLAFNAQRSAFGGELRSLDCQPTLFDISQNPEFQIAAS